MAEEEKKLIPLEDIVSGHDRRVVTRAKKEAKKIEKEAQKEAKKAEKSAKKKESTQSSSSEGPFGFLVPTNQWLEQVPMRVTSAFDNFIGTGENIAQAKVDQICEWLAWKANVQIETMRQSVLKALYKMYSNTVGGKVMKLATATQSFVSDPLGAVGAFASAILGPVKPVLSWFTLLLVEIPKLAENLANIMAALPPTPPNPSINYDKFKLKVGSISLSAIMTDPSTLPPPEVMFPEPEPPFSAASFTKAFETASAKLKSKSKKYELSEDDKNSLTSIINSEVLNPEVEANMKGEKLSAIGEAMDNNISNS